MTTVTTSDSVDIHCVQWGDPDAEPVLFLHGLGADNLGWARQRRAFGRRYRCLAIDNRGSGRSDKPPGPYTLERMAGDAVEVLDALGVAKAHLIGASMGGALAQIVAVAWPERVSSLVLACSACELGWREQLFEEWEELIEAKGMRAFAVENFNWIFGPRSVRRLYPVAALLGPLMLRAPRHGFLAQLQAIRAFDPARSGDPAGSGDPVRPDGPGQVAGSSGSDDPGPATELGRIEVPTLVITGSQDLLTPVADAEEIAARIPGSELAVVRGQAHGLMVEGARVFNEVVLDFLESVAAQGEPEAAEQSADSRRSG